jgi:RHS repeat-associated protein
VFGYTGTYTDTVTADQLHGVRWYDPASQRWLSEDPIGTAGGIDLYEYCGDQPTLATDPTGEKPVGVVYAPRRGYFSDADLGPFMSENEGLLGQVMDSLPRVGSTFNLAWKPNASAFKDPKGGCPLCDLIGFVQVAAGADTYMHYEVPEPSNWSVDPANHGVPYPASETVDPNNIAAVLQMRDAPNALLYTYPWRTLTPWEKLHYLWQKFETAVVCLKGKEGINWGGFVNDSSVHAIRGITVYDTISWEQEIWRPADSPNFEYVRKIDNEEQVGNSDITEWLHPAPSSGPMSEWSKTVIGYAQSKL